MPISEAARLDLYTGLTEVLGPDRAETLMNVLPLHDPDEVATKSDIGLVRSELDGLKSDLDELKTVVARVDAKLDRLILVLVAGLFAVIATLIGVGLTL